MFNFIKKIWITIFFIAINIYFISPSFAQVKTSDDLEHLYQILEVSDSDTTQGYLDLQDFKKEFFSKPRDPKTELAFYKIASSIYVNSNHSNEAKESIEKLAQFANDIGDKNHQLIAQLMQMNFGVNSGDATKGLIQLAKMEPLALSRANEEIYYWFFLKKAKAKELLGYFDVAIEYYLKALKYSDYDQRRKNHFSVYVLTLISSCYLDQKIPSKSLAINLKAQAIARKIKLKKHLLVNLKMLEGSALVDLGKKEDALIAYQKALSLAREAKSLDLELNNLINISDYHLKDRNYTESKKYALQAIAISHKTNNKRSEAVAKINLGLSLAYLGEVKKGVILIQEGMAFQRSLEAVVELEVTLHELAEMYENAGLVKEALATIKEQQALSNILYTDARAKAIVDMQEQFDMEQKSIQINLLEKENALQNTKIQNHSLQTTVWILTSILFVLFGASILVLYYKVKKSNSKLKDVNTKLEFHATHDPLTGLFNRRSFVNLMKNHERSFKEERRHVDDIPDCLILMDLDFFKHVNDKYGHAAGDEVLKVVANRLTSIVREMDMVLRWGGEEFLIYSRQSHIRQAALLVGRILKAIGENSIEFEGKKINITVTCGFISLPFLSNSSTYFGWERTLQIVDMALYLGKKHGRNRAYGIGKILVDEKEALPIITENLADAIEKNMVEFIEIKGAQSAK